MSGFDEEPDGDPHGECAMEISRLTKELAEATAELAAARKHLSYVYMVQMNALVKPVMTYEEWLAAIDSARGEK